VCWDFQQSNYERLIAESASEFFFKSVITWHSYGQKDGLRRALVAKHVLVCNFAKYALI